MDVRRRVAVGLPREARRVVRVPSGRPCAPGPRAVKRGFRAIHRTGAARCFRRLRRIGRARAGLGRAVDDAPHAADRVSAHRVAHTVRVGVALRLARHLAAVLHRAAVDEVVRPAVAAAAALAHLGVPVAGQRAGVLVGAAARQHADVLRVGVGAGDRVLLRLRLGGPRLSVLRGGRRVDAGTKDGARAVVAVLVADARILGRARRSALPLRHVRRVDAARRAGLAIHLNRHVDDVRRSATALARHRRLPPGQLDIGSVDHGSAHLLHAREEHQAREQLHHFRCPTTG